MKSNWEPNSKNNTDIIWSLLRGKHIDHESVEFPVLEDKEEWFAQLFDVLGFVLIRDIHGFFFLEKQGAMDSDEKATANKYCALFFITVQILQDKQGTNKLVDLDFLLNRRGFPLDSILSHSTLQDLYSRILNSLGMDTDEKIQKELNGMERLNLISRVGEGGQWRFRRPIARLERVAQQFLQSEVGEEE